MPEAQTKWPDEPGIQLSQTQSGLKMTTDTLQNNEAKNIISSRAASQLIIDAVARAIS